MCYPMTPDMLLLDIISPCYDMTCHLPNLTLLSCYLSTLGKIYLTLIIITVTGMLTWHLIYILIYYSTNCTPDTPAFLILLACSCSFLKSDNYLINHKGQLTSGRGKLTDQYMFMFTVVLGCCATKIFGLTWGPLGDRGDCWLPPSWYHLEMGIL